MNAKDFAAELELLIRSRYSHIWIETWEEDRARQLIERIAGKLNKKLISWSVSRGFIPAQDGMPDDTNGLNALARVCESEESAIFLFLDFHPYLTEANPQTIRAVRDAAYICRKSRKTMIFISPQANLPPELEKSASVLPLSLPDASELGKLLDAIAASVERNSKLALDMDGELREAIIQAARGLTLLEAESIFTKAAVSQRRLDRNDLSMIISEKKQILRKTGVLEFVETPHTMKSIGGLQRLKSWLESRADALTPAAREFGLPSPKGLLLLGVQGCGKSLVAKSVAHSWQMPLLRLDLGSLFSSYIGSTEANMRTAIRLAESISPTVLWIDEIEKGLSGLKSSGSVDAGVTARIFGSFLSWMQEKTAPVFVVATSNDVSKMPPELLRKGRFDELFFIDLPTAPERRQIFSIHIQLRGRQADEYELDTLAEASDGFSGAEIEQAVIAALYDAFAQGEELNQQHLIAALAQTVPLSETMAEEVSALRTWAENRAVPASKPN